MKSVLTNLLLIFLASLFIKAGCSKSDDDLPKPPANSDEYVTWKISGHQGYLAAPSDSLFLTVQNGTTLFYGVTPFSSSTPGGFYITFNGSSAGTFPITYLDIYTGDKEYVSSSNPLQVTISSFGAIGQYVTGRYSGSVKDSTSNTTVPVTGDFKVKRH